jgi:hypothetical protein
MENIIISNYLMITKYIYWIHPFNLIKKIIKLKNILQNAAQTLMTFMLSKNKLKTIWML